MTGMTENRCACMQLLEQVSHYTCRKRNDTGFLPEDGEKVKKNERQYAKTALRKKQIRQHRSIDRHSDFVPESETGSGLKKAMVIIPLLIILILIVTLIAGITQFSKILDSTKTKPEEESVSQVTAASDDSNLLLVISPESPLPSDYKTNLVDFDGIQVDRCIKDGLEELMSDAAEAGLSLKLSCGYVSAEVQHQQYSAEVSRLQAEESMTAKNAAAQAEKTIPAENCSELQSGLAVKFSQGSSGDFSASREYFWLTANSAKYGFILRYPEGREKSTGFDYDPAHFRVVGKENANKIKTLNMTLEEYNAYLAARSE